MLVLVLEGACHGSWVIHLSMGTNISCSEDRRFITRIRPREDVLMHDIDGHGARRRETGSKKKPDNGCGNYVTERSGAARATITAETNVNGTGASRILDHDASRNPASLRRNILKKNW